MSLREEDKLKTLALFVFIISLFLIAYFLIVKFVGKQEDKSFSICRDEICAFVDRVKFENGCVYGYNMGDEKQFEGCGRYEVKAINKSELPK